MLSPPPPFNTPRLQLRMLQGDDLHDLLKVNGDDEVTRFLPYPSWQSLADGQAWLNRMQARQASGDTLQWVIADLATNEVIGSCLLFRHDEGSARAELGYVQGRAHWGRGYAQEAVQAVIDLAFGARGLRRLEAEIDLRNAASERLLLALGFCSEGLLRERWLINGQPIDSQLFGLLRKEWAGIPTTQSLVAAA